MILYEPELLIDDNVLVPDLAGWQRERLPKPPETNWIAVAPDWVCEVLSPGTARLDRVRKMPIYAMHNVSYIWLIDPDIRILEVFRLEHGKWSLIGSFSENDTVRAEPFQEIEIELKTLWWK